MTWFPSCAAVALACAACAPSFVAGAGGGDSTSIAAAGDGGRSTSGSSVGGGAVGGGDAGGGDPCTTPACPALAWMRRYGDADPQRAYAIAFDPTGTIIVGGEAQGALDFGDGPITGSSAGAPFVAKLDPADGSGIWGRSFGEGGSGRSDPRRRSRPA